MDPSRIPEVESLLRSHGIFKRVPIPRRDLRTVWINPVVVCPHRMRSIRMVRSHSMLMNQEVLGLLIVHPMINKLLRLKFQTLLVFRMHIQFQADIQRNILSVISICNVQLILLSILQSVMVFPNLINI